ncbi:phosphomannomutase [Saccharomonospora glauca K62]|jgi:phosphomannomutase|uniref:Phosphomannomutase n=2 Tax=Saccharomonospora glauca TaxID=40990 RepID=I1CY02_9PSEU|nr:phosphomannomutase [Saccharomonospora glauca K62]
MQIRALFCNMRTAFCDTIDNRGFGHAGVARSARDSPCHYDVMQQKPPRLTPELRDTTFRWIADDVDADSRAQMQDLLARAMAGDPDALSELDDRMNGTLTFGTAGLRGPVRAGPNGMNTAVVVRTTAGLAAWLAKRAPSGTVVVGRDARHGSERFAAAAAEVLDAAGFDVRVLPRPLPTPVLAYATLNLGACAGIQITASHNPPADNGYKVFDHTGIQIIPPADSEIEAEITAAPAAVSIPRGKGARPLGEEILDSYLDRVAELATSGARDLRIAVTPLHGVGGTVVRDALHRAGFTDVHLVEAQAEPDPDFPTVAFPNPEEPGATDLLLNLAADIDADLAIALDPDADRCAVGTRDRDGTWRMLTGDETGVLLGDRLLARTQTADPLVATTLVSSSLLAQVAQAHGARHARTLTGFKWLMRAGERLVYAYEEALGLCVNPDFVKDKDGIAAAVFAADVAAEAKSQGRTLLDLLDDLTLAHGVSVTGQVAPRFADLAERAAVMERLRAEPPTTLAGISVTAEELPEAQALKLSGERIRVIVRLSGTEPKVKAYLEVTTPAPAPEDLAETRRAARETLAALRDDVTNLLTTR